MAGTVHKLQVVDDYVNSVTLVSAQGFPQGWVNWKIAPQTLMDLLYKATDELVQLVESMIPGGADKKATVLDAAGKLYDKFFAPALPIWLKPFNSFIKKFVVNIVLSNVIDFIVQKYNDGSWKPKVA